MPTALVVDDDPNFVLGLAELVGREGFATETATTLRDARAVFDRRIPDVVLLDLQLPDGEGLALLKEFEPGASPEVILITGHASIDTAVEALRLGVLDYLTKPIDYPRLKAVLANLSRTRALKEEIGSLRDELRSLGRFGRLVGVSPAMQRVYDLIARVATEATVLLTGESGVGKEVVALTLHEARRRKQPFLPLNCGAVSPNLIESELFGHERGSFTGADRLHKGYFERSTGGTLFLDEITEMPMELQVKLLRVLETSSVTRIGGSETIKVDVRVIAATNRRPEDAVADGKLRDDLFYRLNVFPIILPPLRERGEDIDLLADYFLDALNKQSGTTKKFSRDAMTRLRAHRWPGNVRELKNVVHRAFILAEEEIGAECVPAEVEVIRDPVGSSLHLEVGVSIAEAERRLIMATLDHSGGDKKRAADTLGISLKTLYNRLNEYKVS